MIEYGRLNIINIILVLILIVPIVNMFQNKNDEDRIFESNDFYAYKVISLVFLLIAILLFVVGVVSLIDKNLQEYIKEFFDSSGEEFFISSGFTYFLIFINYWFSFPKRLVITNESIYYSSRFNNQYKVCENKSIQKYEVEHNGKLKLTFKAKKNAITTQVIFGKLTKDERLKVIKLISERFMEEVN